MAVLMKGEAHLLHVFVVQMKTRRFNVFNNQLEKLQPECRSTDTGKNYKQCRKRRIMHNMVLRAG
jgi:hypothetical protein